MSPILTLRIVTEGALLGGLVTRGVSPDLGVLSDGAQQFVLFVHAACWVHAERPFDKLIPHNEEHRSAIETVRAQLWDLYKDLKAYRDNPDETATPRVDGSLRRLGEQRTGYPSIDGVLKRCVTIKRICCVCWSGPKYRCTTTPWNRTSGNS